MAPALPQGFVAARCPWRIEYDGSLYHFFSRGNNQQDILCDIHVEFGNFVPPVVGADVVVLAGDVHVKNRGLQWIWIHG